MEGNIIQTPSDVQGTRHSVILLDALAAQLVRQVDAMNGFDFEERFKDGQYAFSSDEYGTAKVWAKDSGLSWGRITKANDDDRTMNTLKAIDDFYQQEK